ncbi:MAG: fluoroquinolone transport system ATP-binding protein [Pseudohongiellaceae bacterium]|jgi:fluoroquinolone transport system ATP-binding protein
MIEVESLSFRYPKQPTDTIRGIDFQITQGEIFGFLGPSGSGKSTTQKLLIGLLKNFSGRLKILGKDAARWNHEFYNHIGVGFELPNHFTKLTGLENLRLFASFYGNSAIGAFGKSPAELLELVDLSDAANKPTSQYSKGMKMRLNFARALLNDPELLFLDEPTAGLDPLNARKLKDIIRDLKKQGKTIFLTTHNMHDADELCDRVAFIVEGELKEIGEPQALKRHHGRQSVEVTISDRTGAHPQKKHQFELEGLGANQTFLDLLTSEPIESIHSLEATLEEVFIHATGTHLI